MQAKKNQTQVNNDSALGVTPEIIDESILPNDVVAEAVAQVADQSETPIATGEQPVEITPTQASNDLAAADAATPYTEPENVTFGLGINLIPVMSDAEVKVEETKTKVNLSSLYTILFFVAVTIAIFAINIGYKLTYNAQVKANQEVRDEIMSKAYLVTANNQTLDRLLFLERLDEQSYSPKLVLNFFIDSFAKYGTVTSVNVSNELQFSIVGTAKSYNESALLWHKLTTDPNIKEISIKSVSKPTVGDEVYVTFEGFLNNTNFLKSVID